MQRLENKHWVLKALLSAAITALSIRSILRALSKSKIVWWANPEKYDVPAHLSECTRVLGVWISTKVQKGSVVNGLFSLFTQPGISLKGESGIQIE